MKQRDEIDYQPIRVPVPTEAELARHGMDRELWYAAAAVGVDPRALDLRPKAPEPEEPEEPQGPQEPLPTSLENHEWVAINVFPTKVRKNGIDWRVILDALLYMRLARVMWSRLPSRRFGMTSASVRKACERASKLGLWQALADKLESDTILSPEKKRALKSVCKDWLRRGERYTQQAQVSAAALI